MTAEIVVTGSTGLVGRALSAHLQAHIALQCRPFKLPFGAFRNHPENPVTARAPADTERHWDEALTGAQAVVHLAARVHVMNDTAVDPLAEFRTANVHATLALATAAANRGVRRFIYTSSIKVNGESTAPGRAYTEADVPQPSDPYAISKYEAEIGLRAIAQQTGMEVVIIRPPLVYGPGVRGNFAALIRAVQRGLPLPLGRVHNLRSLVAVDNLADFILSCLTRTAAANQTFLVSDGEDLSSAELVRKLAWAMGRPARLLPVPPALLEFTAALVGRRAAAQRLCASLQINLCKASSLLGWQAPIPVDEGLRRAVMGLTRA